MCYQWSHRNSTMDIVNALIWKGYIFFKAATKIQNKTVDFNGRFYNVFSLVRKSESHRSVKIDLPFSLILASFVISLIHIHFTLFYLRIICF